MERPLTEYLPADGSALDLDGYERAGGYRALRKGALRDGAAEVTAQVKASNLRGARRRRLSHRAQVAGGADGGKGAKAEVLRLQRRRDGARHVQGSPAARGKSAPGARRDDARRLRGQAEVGYVFLRWAYRARRGALRAAIAEAYQRGIPRQKILGSPFSLDLHLHVSAGRYMCGEETGLLNSLEGRAPCRAPSRRIRRRAGLWGKPMVVQNVETLCNVPPIVERGAAWYRALEPTDDGGTKIYGASGRVKRPGAWELPMGTTIREILRARGRHARRLRAPRRHSRRRLDRLLIEEHLDVKMDFDVGGEGGQPHGHRHDDRPRRRDLSGRDGAQPRAVLRARVVRLVHALSRGAALGGAHSPGDRTGQGQTPISSSWRSSTGCSGPVRLFARSRPAPSSRCRARSNISAKTSSATSANGAARGRTGA